VRARRVAAWALVSALAAVPATLLPTGAARADVTSIPGTLSTAAQNTSALQVPVPAGVQVSAINAVVTQSEVTDGTVISFLVNGAVRLQVPSALYQKVSVPVTQADVVADGTIAFSVLTSTTPAAGATCAPAGGVAALRKIELQYTGTETPPTTLADFFPESSSGITVVIPSDADDDMITAGLTAVAALAYRYDDATPVNLSLNVPDAATATASQRVVALTPGRAGEVTTAVSTTSGIPLLTFTGAGDDLVDAVRTLSTDALGLSGTDAVDPSLQTKPRSTATERTLDDLGVDPVALTGYGSVTQQIELRQDSFGEPVDAMSLHLEGTHTAFAAASGARLDVRANGTLIGSTVLGDEARFDLDVKVPASQLRSVNDITMTLTAVAPDGSACTPPSIPAAEVDVDAGESTVTVSHGTGKTQGFQLFPQIFEGTLPVALRATEGRKASAAINAAALIAALQRAAGTPLKVQLMEPDTFLADDRSGLMVGALAADSEALDAPLKLSSTRLLDREDSVQEITSQDPYAVLESIDRNNRLVLMLGSWAPSDKAAPGELARKVVDAVVNTGWADLDGDLVIADTANPAFVTASRSLAPHQTVEEEKSYAKWFVVVIGVLLLLLALQVVVAIRRDRQLSREREEDELGPDADGPAFVEDEGWDDPAPETYEVDALGDVDDLEVHDYAERADDEDPEADADADEGDDEFEWSEDDELDELEDDDWDEGEDDDWGDWGEESDEIGPGQGSEPADEEPVEQPADEPDEPDGAEPPRRRWSDEPEAEEPEPEPDPEPEPPSTKRTRRRRRG
jgi:hypothetical protein